MRYQSESRNEVQRNVDEIYYITTIYFTFLLSGDLAYSFQLAREFRSCFSFSFSLSFHFHRNTFHITSFHIGTSHNNTFHIAWTLSETLLSFSFSFSFLAETFSYTAFTTLATGISAFSQTYDVVLFWVQFNAIQQQLQIKLRW